MKKSKSKIAVRQVKFKAANTAQIGTINIFNFYMLLPFWGIAIS